MSDQQEPNGDTPVEEPATEEQAPTPEEPAKEKEPPKVTTAAEWRRDSRTRYLFMLPSGVTVKARKVDPTELMAEGLLSLEEFTDIGAGGGGVDKLPLRIEIARRCCTRIVVQPAVVMRNGTAPDPTEDIVVADEIPALDAMVLFGWSFGLRSGSLPFSVQELPRD